MTKTNINKPKGDEQISRMLGIRHSFISNTNGIKKFVSNLKPVVEEADKSFSEEVINALQLAYKTAGIKFPATEEAENVTEEQKKAIYRNLKLPELFYKNFTSTPFLKVPIQSGYNNSPKRYILQKRGEII